MLAELHIRDFAIVDDLQLEFPPGFLVLTGETGAGKSIIVDAVSLVLGGRADSSVVRAGSDRALVEGLFRLESWERASVDPLLQRDGLDDENGGFLLLGREVRVNGRNICRVNGRAVTLALLREVAQGLVDIHGQTEHLSLLRTRDQLALLDRYALLEERREHAAVLVRGVREVRRELADLALHEQTLVHRADLLRFQIGEIAAAGLSPGEEEGLLGERLRLANAEQLTSLAHQALSALGDGTEAGPAARDLLGAAHRALQGLVRVDPSLETQLRSLEEASYLAEELVGTLHDYRDQTEYNPERLQEVVERIALIRKLERKYGKTIADVLAYADGAARELNRITHSEDRMAELRAEERSLLCELKERAASVSSLRQEAAHRLAREVEEQLQDLQMEGARFGVMFDWRVDLRGVPMDATWRELKVRATSGGVEPLELRDTTGDPPCLAFDSSGIDRVEFVVSTNPGEPLRPMSRIASGGETSRLMLALKTVLSQADQTPTLVFDEIDQGIGGRVGAKVGEKLWRLTAGASGPMRQVLCVTHLPQLAGYGDAHLRIKKEVRGDRVVTRAQCLEGNARVEEIAQMLGAASDAGHRSAQEILEKAARQKTLTGAQVPESRKD